MPALAQPPLASSEATMPVRMPAITSGSTDEPSAVPCSPAEATSTTVTPSPASAAAWPSSCATAGLAAEEVRTLSPPGPATQAP
jgi:hypothetical protein